MNYIKNILIIISLFLLSACSGGGGDTQPTGTVIKGVASKGIIVNGTVTVFALKTDGSKGAQLGTGSTDGAGAYNISIGSYTGPVTVEAYGSYTDEATGLPMTVPASSPLRAAVADASGAVSLSVTPLTDLAVRQAGVLTPQNITSANALISDLFKFDIVTTAPAAPTSGAFQSSTTTQAQKDYALALAAVSQQMQIGGTNLATTLTTLSNGISQSGMDQLTAATLATAINSFIANPVNQTGVTTVAGTSLQTVGTTSMKLTVVLQGNAAASVKGIQTTITFPAGVALRAEATGEVMSGVLTQAANTPTGTVIGKYTAAANGAPASVTIGFPTLTTGSFAAGDVLILNADLSAGVSAPTAAAFIFSGSKLVDADGNSVGGASLALR